LVKKTDTFLLLFQIKIRDSKARLENALVKRFYGVALMSVQDLHRKQQARYVLSQCTE